MIAAKLAFIIVMEVGEADRLGNNLYGYKYAYLLSALSVADSDLKCIIHSYRLLTIILGHVLIKFDLRIPIKLTLIK